MNTSSGYALTSDLGSVLAAIAVLGGCAVIRWQLRRTERAIAVYAAMGVDD
jgi:hypothetical protein